MSRVALVTGANRGIGMEISRQLLQVGMTVIMTARDASKGQQAAEELARQGNSPVFIEMDVTSENSVHLACKQALQRFGRVDVLINNAGVYLDEGVSILNVPFSDFQTTFEVNLFGAFLTSQALIASMRQNNYGRIVNVSSGYGEMNATTSAHTGAYKLSKLALNGLTRLMADGVHGANIKINTMDPGWVRTDMGGSHAPRSPHEGADTAVWLATLPDNGPTGGFFRDRKPVAW
jgi:NAD(P)-dependent dehydrogenase (short-subunit alcohol dehydrogenase family)